MPSAVTDLRAADAVTSTGILTVTLRWTSPANAVTSTLRYSRTLITEASWTSAGLFTNTLPGDNSTYTSSVPYTTGVVYFAHKSQNADGIWSALSNDAFWPQHQLDLPIMMK